MKTRGWLFVFEGIDGAGKSTQARLLRDLLVARGLSVLLTREPTHGPHGRALRESASAGRLTAEEERALFLADRRQHVSEEIEPHLSRGGAVVLDRYYLSTAAYQGARGLDPDAILAENEAFAPTPDVCFLLEVDPAQGIGRVRGRGGAPDLFEQAESLTRCGEIFRRIERPWIRRLDGGRDPAALHAQIAAEVIPMVDHGRPPL